MQIAKEIGKDSFKDIISNLHCESLNECTWAVSHILTALPDKINSTYIDQSSYWLTFFPLRGFLAVFDLAQIINLVWLSFKTQYVSALPSGSIIDLLQACSVARLEISANGPSLRTLSMQSIMATR